MADVNDRRPIGYLLQFAAVVLFVFSFSLLVSGRIMTATFALGLGIVAALGWYASRSGPARWKLQAARGASLVVAMLALGSLTGVMPEFVFWNLLIPLLFFLLWSVRWAALLSLAFILAVMLLSALESQLLGLLRHQLVPALLLATLLTGLFVYLREIKGRQLAPLRRTDALTLASTQEHLQVDLHTEIQRSEREGTALAIVHLALDPTDRRLAKADQDILLRHLGRLLNEHLRIFDCYYRINETGFILTLPCTDTAGAVRQAESIRAATAQSMKTMGVRRSLSAGITALNVGDDASTLIRRAGEGLARAQARGGDRTQPWNGQTDDRPREGGVRT